MQFARWPLAAGIVWLVVGTLFFLVMIAHVRGRSVSFDHIPIPNRETSQPDASPTQPQAGMIITPGGVETPNLTVKNVDLDKPLDDFAGNFNKYIDIVNEKNKEENGWLIFLDIIGWASAYFSAAYELRKSMIAPSA